MSAQNNATLQALCRYSECVSKALKKMIEQFELEKMPVSEENINMFELLSVYCTPLIGFLVCAGKMFEWIPPYCYPIDCLVSISAAIS